jgi:hypothetical protein
MPPKTQAEPQSQGVFGYTIGRKKRMMYVYHDADLLWQILVREIFVLMKHFGTKETMQTAFEKIKPTKSKPTASDVEKYQPFADLEGAFSEDWSALLWHCQSSYINILEAGHIVNQKDDVGASFILDFNKGAVIYSYKELHGKSKIIETATIEEIMSFDEMPTKSYTEIVDEMRERFAEFHVKYQKAQEQFVKLSNIITESRRQCSYNIEEKARKLLDDVISEKKQLVAKRRAFYYRLKALDLIESDIKQA